MTAITTAIGGYGKNIVRGSLDLYLDAALSQSYSGSGTTWSSISGAANSLTLTNTPTFDTSGFFTFNGSSQYARTTTLPTTAITNFSMSAWIWPANINHIGMAVSNGRDDGTTTPFNGYAFGIGNGAGAAGAKFQALLQGTAWLDTGYTYPSASAWYNIVWTRDTTTHRFYVNGTQTASTFTTAPTTPTAQFSVGAAFGNVGARYFNGRIAAVMIYTKQLTQDEITQNYFAGRSRFGI